jgi:glycosyltransferase involved in cell wall biosynthesis
MKSPSPNRILMSAYACRPHLGSEAEVGWSMAREMAKYYDVWVVTRSDNRAAIEAQMAAEAIPRLQFVYHNLPWTRWWNPGVQIHYYLWQLKTYFVVRQHHRAIGFDLVHHVTYVKYYAPSFLAFLPIPLIWGPVGGAESAPKPFWQDFSLRGKIYEYIRDLARGIGEQDYFVRLTARRSAIALSTTSETAQRLHKLGSTRIQMMSEAGLSMAEIETFAQPYAAQSPTTRFVSMGRLLHWKGFHLSLRALAQSGLHDYEYWIIGQGPEHNRLQALTKTLGIADHVTFWGHLPRIEALAKLKQSHILLHPSLHDSGGWVCLEAMAMGRPVICLDLGGPATQITATTGIKIRAHTPRQTVQDLATAITGLANDTVRQAEMGQAGQRHIRTSYSWATKGKYWVGLYTELLLSQELADET